MRQKPRSPVYHSAKVAVKILHEILKLPPKSRRRFVEAWQEFFAEEDQQACDPATKIQRLQEEAYAIVNAQSTPPPTDSPSRLQTEEDVALSTVDESLMWRLSPFEQRMVIHVVTVVLQQVRKKADRLALATRFLENLFAPPLLGD